MSNEAMTVGELIETLKKHYNPDEAVIAQWYTIGDFFYYGEDDTDLLTQGVFEVVASRVDSDDLWQYSKDSIEQLIADEIENPDRGE